MMPLPDHPALSIGERRSRQIQMKLLREIMDITDSQPRSLIRNVHQLAPFKKAVAVSLNPSRRIDGLAECQTPLEKMRDHLLETISIKNPQKVALATHRLI
jgi:hypothetical protein